MSWWWRRRGGRGEAAVASQGSERGGGYQGREEDVKEGVGVGVDVWRRE